MPLLDPAKPKVAPMRLAAALLAFVCTIPAAQASGPASDRKPPVLMKIVIEPEGELHLVGAGARQQVLVTGHYDDGSLRDLTASASFGASASVFRVDGGVVHALKDGAGTLTA